MISFSGVAGKAISFFKGSAPGVQRREEEVKGRLHKSEAERGEEERGAWREIKEEVVWEEVKERGEVVNLEGVCC